MGARLQGLMAAEQILREERANDELRRRFEIEQAQKEKDRQVGLMQFNANKDLEQQRLNLSANAQDAQLQRQDIADARQAEADRKANEIYSNYTVPQEQLKLAELQKKIGKPSEADSAMEAIANMTGSRLYTPEQLDKNPSLFADGTMKAFQLSGSKKLVVVPADTDLDALAKGKNPKPEKPLADSKYFLTVDTTGGKAKANMALRKMSDSGLIKGDIQEEDFSGKTKYSKEAYGALDAYNAVAEQNPTANTEQIIRMMKDSMRQDKNTASVADMKVPQLDQDFIAKVKALPDSDPRKAIALRKINAGKTASK